MRYAPRLLVCLLSTLVVVNLASAQKSEREVAKEDSSALGRLKDPGGREKHQGADNPMQGNTSTDRRGATPDPYGRENFKQFTEKNERRFYDPQWQLKLDLYDPKRIVIEYPDGTSQEYWYVLFRVINDNTRLNHNTTNPNLNAEGELKPHPVSTDRRDGVAEGVPIETTLDMEVVTYTRNIDRSPWDNSREALLDDQMAQLSENQRTPEVRAAIYNNIAKKHRPVSDPYVLQQIAIKEELYEWVEAPNNEQERLILLHPMSDFQRQTGLVHKLEAPDYSGPRCLPVRMVRTEGATRTEIIRFVGVHDDNTFAGYFGKDETAPEGVRIISDASDPLWGSLTKRRYAVKDCVDRFGRVLQTNDPGYLNARVAGGDAGNSEYGVLNEGHSLVGTPVRIPRYRRYRAASGGKPTDKVIFEFDTKVPVPGHVEDNYFINGRIVTAASTYGVGADAVNLWDAGTEVTDDLEQFGGKVAGKPVKMTDHLGRAIKRYLVTYQAGDRISQAEWDILRRRLGKGLLARFGNPSNLHERPLNFDDPVVGMPKIKMGKGLLPDDLGPEVITRGVDVGDRDKKTGAPLLKKVENFTTGRTYDPLKITPAHFMRDPDGTFTTHRKAPLPENSGLEEGEDYVYAPLGVAQEDAIPVPHFDRMDQFGAWEDYRDPISGARIPLTDEQGELVRDEFDQILYLKEYEYEYVYMYEYEPQDETDPGFKGSFGGDRQLLVKKGVEKMKVSGSEDKKVYHGPVRQLIVETRKVTMPKTAEYRGRVKEDGTTEWIKADEYAAKPDEDKKAYVLRDLRVEIVTEDEDVVVGVYVEGDTRYDKDKHKLVDEPLPEGMRVENTSSSENPREKVIDYLERMRDRRVAGGEVQALTDDDFMPEGTTDNKIRPIKASYRRWTIPPPLVYRNPNPTPGNEWTVLTRFSEAYGPARRADGKDAPRFLTRYISEMWGVFIFKSLDREWDYMNVMVTGLRGHVAHAGLKLAPGKLPKHTTPGASGQEIDKAFFDPRLMTENWVHRTRFERLGDGLEAYRDLIRRQQTYWYLASKDGDYKRVEIGDEVPDASSEPPTD